MKVKIKLMLAVLVVAACEQKEASPLVEVTGLLNGVEWARSGWTFRANAYPTQAVASYPCDLGTIDIKIYALNPQGYERESLSLIKIPKRLGRYPVTNIYPCAQNVDIGAFYGVLGADGDALRGVFNVVESADNYLVVERIDSTANRWAGRLQLTLALSPKDRRSSVPYDTVRLTNCRFDIPFRKN